MTRKTYKLLAAKGGGSMIIEAAFALAKIPLDVEYFSWTDLGLEHEEIRTVNPLQQVPSLVCPDGAVMTESAAILMHLDDIAPGVGLVPPPDHPKRRDFLRFLMLINTAIYPSFTYGDSPVKWLKGDEAAGKVLRTATDDHRKTLWRYVESWTGAPWFLGDAFSAIDLYLWPMTWWRPGRDWFKAEAPRLHAIALKVEAIPEITQVKARQE
ncbi:MAG: glutathione S-transferase family protein [Micropepsaceae bacterium]